jgi:glutathione S-transferase
MTMSITFYYSPMSSAVIAHWALEELGVPVEKVKIDLTKGEQKKPEYVALNPNGKVPLLVVDGTPIFETVAILSYLGETYGVEKGLYPAAGLKRAEAIKWMAWAGVTLGEALSRYSHAGHERFPKELHHEPSRARGKADVESCVAILEGELTKSKRPYLLGDAFTLVDLQLSGWVGYLGMMGFDLAKYPTVVAWSQRCTQRPAFGKVMSER